MSTDYVEKEREFLATLEADTGRSLESWLAAIGAQAFSDKNDCIDWLRSQGFMFWKASWLERIYSNGGRPIYATDHLPASPAAKPSAPAETTLSAPGPAETAAPPPSDQQVEPLTLSPPDSNAAPSSVPPPASIETPGAHSGDVTSSDNAVADLVAKGKALAPLARHVLREIEKAVPGTRLSAEAGYISLSAQAEFAILVIGAKALRLGVALTSHVAEAPWGPPRFPPPTGRVPPSITHVAVLNDARQIDAALISVVARAAREEAP